MYQPSNRISENVLFALLLAALVAWTAAGVGAELTTVPSDRASEICGDSGHASTA